MLADSDACSHWHHGLSDPRVNSQLLIARRSFPNRRRFKLLVFAALQELVHKGLIRRACLFAKFFEVFDDVGVEADCHASLELGGVGLGAFRCIFVQHKVMGNSLLLFVDPTLLYLHQSWVTILRSSVIEGRLQLLDVELFHLPHLDRHCFFLRPVLGRVPLVEFRGHDLPANAELVDQSAACHGPTSARR